MVIDGLLHRVIMPSIMETVPKPILASEMLSSTTDQVPPSVSSGWASIDRILGGHGWQAGQVSEISGASGSGKTQICLVSAVKLLLEHDNSRVIWIETNNGSFSAERANNTAKAQLKKIASKQDSRDIETRLRHVLDRITIYTCPDINSLLDTIQQLHAELPPLANRPPIFVVIDPLSAILTNLLWAPDGAGPATIMHTSRQLRVLAHDLSVAVVITNVAVQLNGPEEQSPSILQSSVAKPGLGISWRFATDLQLFVSRLETPPSQWGHPMQSSEVLPSQQVARLAEIVRSKRQVSGEFHKYSPLFCTLLIIPTAPA
ncbi:MAG: P-loop containing nucleoside triphosphate hydrolase protein [Podila humilis]|nr:MAG: P-loop containing nucleoside triphosphate hydrolase protein [Podila humilis]